MNHKAKIFFLFLMFFSPIMVSAASITISEIMYDPAGADTGREWIEIFNSTSSTIDLTGWKFFEEGSNHGLASFQGGMSLGANSYAIIVSDPSKFQIDYPNFSGIIIDSSWSSFNNAGESLAIKDNSNALIFEVTYIGGGQAAGDGNSLQFLNGAWVAGLPTPGAPNSSETTQGENQNAGSSNSASSSSGDIEKELLTNKELTITVSTDPRAIVGVPFRIKTKVIDERGSPSEVGKFVWNFGDGVQEEYENVTEFFHIYKYPGKYVAYLDYSKKPYTYDKDGLVKIIVEVLEPSLRIKSINISGAIEIENESSNDRDISGWMLSYNSQYFIFPPRSILLSKSTLFISPESHKLSGLSLNSKVNLLLPSGEFYSTYPIETIKPKVYTPVLKSNTVSVQNKPEELPKDEIGSQQASVVLAESFEKKGANPKVFIGAFILFCLLAMFTYYRFGRKKLQEGDEADDYKILS